MGWWVFLNNGTQEAHSTWATVLQLIPMLPVVDFPEDGKLQKPSNQISMLQDMAVSDLKNPSPAMTTNGESINHSTLQWELHPSPPFLTRK